MRRTFVNESLRLTSHMVKWRSVKTSNYKSKGPNSWFEMCVAPSPLVVPGIPTKTRLVSRTMSLSPIEIIIYLLHYCYCRPNTSRNRSVTCRKIRHWIVRQGWDLLACYPCLLVITQFLAPRPSTRLHFQSHCVQFSSVVNTVYYV